MAGKKQTSREQELAITQMVLEERLGASQIYRALEKNGLLDPPHPNITLRTVQARVRELSVRDESGPWSFADADPEEARHVLDVAANFGKFAQGLELLTRAHAAQIARLRIAVPDIPPTWAYILAGEYQRCEDQKRDSRHLDFAIGVRPWAGWLGADQIARAFGLPRSFKVHRSSGTLDVTDSALLLVAIVAFRGSIEDIGSRRESETQDSIPHPPEIIWIDRGASIIDEDQRAAAQPANAVWVEDVPRSSR